MSPLEKVKPYKYELTLEPQISKSFIGKVRIELKVLQKTNVIQLDASSRYIFIQTVDCLFAPDDARKQNHLEYCHVDNSLAIYFKSHIRANSWVVIEIDYTGTLNDKEKTGLFTYTSLDGRGNPVVNIGSQFEHNYARQCFPCFDRPNLRTEFDLTLIVEKGLLAISCSPVLSRKPFASNRTKEVIKFKQTASIPSYLLGIYIGKFSKISGKLGGRYRCDIFGESRKLESAHFLLDVLIGGIKAFESVLGLPCHSSNLNIVLVPDFIHEGMEHENLLVFDEDSVLLENCKPYAQLSSDNDDDYDAISTLLLITHEISHLQFGNLASISNWAGGWWKEGYSEFFKFLLAREMILDFKMKKEFYRRITAEAMAKDGSDNSKPLENENEPFKGFSMSAYFKGAAVIRMMYNLLGQASFIDSTKRWLINSKLRSITSTEIWNFYNWQTHPDISKMMFKWTKVQGFPIIRVVKTTFRKNVRSFTLHQEKYSDDKHKKYSYESDWIIPIKVVKVAPKFAEIRMLTMKNSKCIIRLKNVKKDDIFMINPGFQDFYKVKIEMNVTNLCQYTDNLNY